MTAGSLKNYGISKVYIHHDVEADTVFIALFNSSNKMIFDCIKNGYVSYNDSAEYCIAEYEKKLLRSITPDAESKNDKCDNEKTNENIG